MQTMELSTLGGLELSAVDAGAVDAGDPPDGGANDSGARDAAHEADAGKHDAHVEPDAHALDAAHEDAHHADAAREDAHARDGGRDAKSEDARAVDARGSDVEVHDAGPISPDFVADGERRLTEWITFSRASGIGEFDSPVYYETDLDSLWMGYRYAPVDDRPRYAAILSSLWADISASTVVAHGTLVGPYSRTLDFFRDHGDLEVALYLEGLRFGPPITFAGTLPDLDTVFALVNQAPGGFHPDHPTLCLSQGVREVRSTFDDGPSDAGNAGRQRYLYVTGDYALGSTSADYIPTPNNQDEAIVAEFPTFDMPVLTVLPDYFDAPGQPVIDGGTPLHLPLNPASAQLGGALLVLLRIDAHDPYYLGADGGRLHPKNLSTNIVFPAGADEVWLNGRDVDAAAPLAFGTTPTLVVRQGAGAVAVRVLESSGVECLATAPEGGLTGGAIRDRDSGPSAGYSLAQSFPDASFQNVGRVALYHLGTADMPSDTDGLAPCFARVALLVLAGSCDGPTCGSDLAAAVDYAEVHDTWDPVTGGWDVSASVLPPNGSAVVLHVTRTIEGDEAIPATRTVDDLPLVFDPLEVDDAGILIAP
jgi:hypothetical protein